MNKLLLHLVAFTFFETKYAYLYFIGIRNYLLDIGRYKVIQKSYKNSKPKYLNRDLSKYFKHQVALKNFKSK